MPSHWDTTPADWDTCVLGKYQLPGVAKVSVKRARKLDKKSAKGRNGATITDGGGEGADVNIELSMTTAEEWNAWCAALKILDPTKVAPQAYDIVHPQAEAYQVASVMIEAIDSGPPDNGIYTVKIKCAEWFPKQKGTAKAKVTTPTGAAGAANILDMSRDSKLAKQAASFDKASGGQFGPPPFPSTSENKP